nr:TPM domain-containing protein [Microbacterium bovistercoris]
MRVRRIVAGLVACAALILAPAAAFATDPVTLGQDYVLDDAAALTASQHDDAEQAAQKFADDTDMNLWVVYVDEFTSPSDAEGWANQTASQNGLGPNQYLLAVAVTSRQFYLSGDSSGPVSTEALGTIEQQRIQPALASEDWAGAVTAATAGLADAASGGSGAADGSSGSGGGVLTVILIIVVVVVAIVLVIVLVRSRRRKAAAGTSGPALQRLDLKELVRRAGSALVQTDDALRTSEQELGFARAQFGDDATGEFAAALAQAKANLDAAFALKQKLDDATEDTEEQQRAWNAQIIQLCEESNKSLDEKAAAFDELRKLEQNAPEALDRVHRQREDAQAAMDAAAARLQQLTAEYAPEALTTVTDNIAQAQQRLAFADEQLAAAAQAIAAGEGGQAAVAIRAAEQAADQAQLLEAAIGKLGDDLAAGQQQAAALIQELEGDIATASGLPDADGQVAAAVTAAQAQVEAARADIASAQKRPLATLKGLEAVNAQIDQVVAGARDAQARRRRAEQMLGQTINQAQAQVSAAEDYVTARRGAIGADARTRLAQAGAELVQAQQLQSTDPDQALQHAQRADQLAGLALQGAQSDVGGFGGAGLGGSGGGGNMLGAMLGGIVINSLLSGGGRRGGFGGGRRGGGGGGGGFSAGSFGGGGTRGRRGGGRF